MEQEFPGLFTSLNAAFKNISIDSFFLTEKEEENLEEQDS